jgi:hypothetical protein
MFVKQNLDYWLLFYLNLLSSYIIFFQMLTNCLTNESNETHDFDAKLQVMWQMNVKIGTKLGSMWGVSNT